MTRVLKHYRFSKTFAKIRRLTSRRRNSISAIRNLYHSIGLEEKGCLLCGSKEFSLLAECDRYGFDLKKQICEDCGLIQTQPALSAEFHSEFYSKYYRKLYTNSETVNYESLLEEQFGKGARFKQFLEEQNLSAPLNQYHVVEIGCSSAGILAALKPHVRSVQGCDLDIDAIAFAKKKFAFKVEVGKLPEIIGEGPRIFILSHVLEHLQNPKASLKDIKHLMANGDYLFIEVPGLNMLRKGAYKHDLRRYFHIAHVSDFTAGTLTAMSKEVGFQIDYIDEEVRALLEIVDSDSLEWSKSEHDNIENIRDIETSRPNPLKKIFNAE